VRDPVDDPSHRDRLQIVRLRRMQFGRSSERIARTIEQLELRLEELEAETPGATGDAFAGNSEPSSASEAASPRERKQSERRTLPASAASPVRDCWRTFWSANIATIFRCTGNPASMCVKASNSIGPPWRRGSARSRRWPHRWSKPLPTM
jgi:hypothetical protein